MPTFKNIKPRQTLENISKSLFSDRLVLTFAIAWVFAVTLTLVYTSYFFKNLPLQVPLFYSRPWGEQQLAGQALIFVPVAGSFIFGLVSFLLASYSIKEKRVLGYILSGSAPLVAILAMITTLNIVNLVK